MTEAEWLAGSDPGPMLKFPRHTRLAARPLTGLAVTSVVGVLAGLVPAWQASRAEIVASLRHV
jgi:hypothetical protein